LSLDIRKLLKTVVAHKASDLHLISRAEPQIRLDGKLAPLEMDTLDGKDIETMCYSLLTEQQKKVFEEHNEIDFSLELPEVGRFRVNYYRTLGDVAAAFRIIPITIPSLDSLDAPLIIKELSKKEKGLILVTGPTGSGKSTTLAAMLNEINQASHSHIITIEDPVEFIHTNNNSVFSHRNVGSDTKSFAHAIKYSLREDPDVILIGEMRDKETISAALTAAETGHVVFATLHTNSAVQTMDRIVDAFDGNEQAQIRAQLSSSLVAVVSQSLIPKANGGRLAVHEILINNPAIANLIREDKTHQLYSQMQINQNATGMKTQTQEMVKYLKEGTIKKDDAIRYSNRHEELIRLLQNL